MAFKRASRRNCFADRTTTHTSGNSSIDTSLIRDIYYGPGVLFETCVAMKFVDDDDNDDGRCRASRVIEGSTVGLKLNVNEKLESRREETNHRVRISPR